MLTQEFSRCWEDFDKTIAFSCILFTNMFNSWTKKVTCTHGAEQQGVPFNSQFLVYFSIPKPSLIIPNFTVFWSVRQQPNKSLFCAVYFQQVVWFQDAKPMRFWSKSNWARWGETHHIDNCTAIKLMDLIQNGGGSPLM